VVADPGGGQIHSPAGVAAIATGKPGDVAQPGDLSEWPIPVGEGDAPPRSPLDIEDQEGPKWWRWVMPFPVTSPRQRRRLRRSGILSLALAAVWLANGLTSGGWWGWLMLAMVPVGVTHGIATLVASRDDPTRRPSSPSPSRKAQ
jgi:hypothetical protein